MLALMEAFLVVLVLVLRRDDAVRFTQTLAKYIEFTQNRDIVQAEAHASQRERHSQTVSKLLDRIMARDLTELKTVGSLPDTQATASRPSVVTDEDEARYQEQMAAAQRAEERMGAVEE